MVLRLIVELQKMGVSYLSNIEKNCLNCLFSLQHNNDSLMECDNPKCGEFGTYMDESEIITDCEFFECDNVSDETVNEQNCEHCKFYKKELIDPCCWVHWCESKHERIESLCSFCMKYQPKVEEDVEKSENAEFNRNYKLFKDLREDRPKRDTIEENDTYYQDVDVSEDVKKFDFETLKSIVGESDFRTYLKARITLLWNRFYKYEDRSVLPEIDICRSILEQDLNGWNSYDYE